jgi:riboflavin kinase/FMN adenylyltransferase
VYRWTDPSQTPADLRPSVATFGNFDGVHRGHRAVLSRLVAEATHRGIASVAVTFDPHPAAIFHPEGGFDLIAPGRLRDELMEATGLDGLLVIDFTEEFAQQTAEEFIVHTFVETLGVQALVVGEDARGFGRGYTGDVDTLRELGARHGFDVVVLEDLGEGERWSSSAVRRHLAAGEVAEAATILGRPHRMTGTVVHGAHRGRDLGYPTANLAADSLGLVPADGVYAGWLTRVGKPVDDPERTLPAAISVGTNPTFDGTVRTVEAYVLDRTDLELYGVEVEVSFVARIRGMLRFDSVAELVATMAQDVARTRAVLGVTDRR